MTNYHRGADGTWKRCRATKRPGNGVSGCAIGNMSHAVGRQGVADNGGGVIMESRANGIPMVTTISKLDKNSQTFEAISQAGKKRVYLADGRLLTKKERVWYEDGSLWKKIRLPQSLIRQYRQKLYHESLKFRQFDEFREYDFGNEKQNLERDIFMRWFDETDHLGIDLEKLHVRFGDDNNQENKEPDIIVQGDDFEKPLGVEIVQVFKNVDQAKATKAKYADLEGDFADATYAELLEKFKITLDKKCSKKYVRNKLGYLVLLASNETGHALEERLGRDTKRDSMLFDEAWAISDLPEGARTLRLGVNADRQSTIAQTR